MPRTRQREVAWKGALSGVAAGLAGTLAMSAAQALWMRARRAREPQRGPGGSDADPTTVRMAQQVSRAVLGRDLMPYEKPLAGRVVHYGFGTGVGTAYGVLAEYAPAVTAAAGLPFGAALMLLADEVAGPALHLSPPPEEQPAGVHAYALVSHLVYGAAVEGVRRSLRTLL